MEIIEIKKYYGDTQSGEDRRQDRHQSLSRAHGDGSEGKGRQTRQDAWSSAGGPESAGTANGPSSGKWGVVLSLPRRKVSDDLIYSRIIFGLFSDPLVEDTYIGVRVVDGLVTLSGTVAERCHKVRAEKIAANEDGVTMVRNLLMVAPVCSTSDGIC